MTRWIRGRPLVLLLPVQALLLFWNLELLPVWTDERHTVQTVALPARAIGPAVAADIHPPLYFLLLREWLQLPLPGSPIARMRAFSALWALLATVALARLWAPEAEAAVRWRLLVLWTLSPCVLLYARMARSYTMQVFLALTALYAAVRFLREPASTRALTAFVLSAAALLYTHYAPGAAVLAAASVAFTWGALRRRDARLASRAVAASALVAIAYLPWLLELRGALAKWAGRSGHYHVTSSLLLDQTVKLGYWFTSFSFGETLPPLMLLAAAALSPAVLWLAWRGARDAREWMPLVLPAAALGCLGVSYWVSFPFLPARLLFLLPFYLLLIAHGSRRAGRSGAAICGTLLLIYGASISSYFQRADFLNKGYAAPFDEMAELVKHDAPAGETLIILDTFNTDAFPLLDRLEGAAPVILVRDESVFEAVAQARRRGGARVIWYLRNTHDTSPGGLNRRLEAELDDDYQVRKRLFQPYSWLERFAIRLAGWPEQPTHFYQVTRYEMTRPAAGGRCGLCSRAEPLWDNRPRDGQEGKGGI